MILDTAAPKQSKKQRALLRGGTQYNLHERTLAVLRLQKETPDDNPSPHEAPTAARARE